jgi:hypothetical protein
MASILLYFTLGTFCIVLDLQYARQSWRSIRGIDSAIGLMVYWYHSRSACGMPLAQFPVGQVCLSADLTVYSGWPHVSTSLIQIQVRHLSKQQSSPDVTFQRVPAPVFAPVRILVLQPCPWTTMPALDQLPCHTFQHPSFRSARQQAET